MSSTENMNLLEFKNALKKRVPNDTSEVFRLLDRHLESQSDLRKDLILLNGKYNSFERDRIRGKLSNEEISRTQTIHWESLIDYIELIEREDMRKQKPFKILVLCSTSIDKEYMEQYFSALPPRFDADVFLYNNPFSPEDYALIIFDNHTIGRISKEEDIEKLSEDQKGLIYLMKEYLLNAPKWLIHFGEYFYLLNDYREVTNAANSKFSLYNCINYMKDFIENYWVGRTDR